MKGEKNMVWQPETQPKGKPPVEKTKGAETMQRLIDANALKLSHCKECTLYPDKCMGKDCDWHAIIHINEMPTIDAIPIEWIEKQRKSMKKGSDREQNIGWLLKDWEKENGTEAD